MKITAKDPYSPKTVAFDVLKAGEVFSAVGQQDYFIRVAKSFGATRLRDGTYISSWSADTMCTVYNAELVLEVQYE